jgi:thiol-disulfide isomerase/thioredoxin
MRHFFKHLLIFSYAILALACSHSNVPTGKATLSGKFSGSFQSGQTSVIVSFPIPVFNKTVEYETLLNEDGSFSISVPVFYPTYTQIIVGNEEYAGSLLLSPDKETKIELSFNEAEEIQVKFIEGSGLTPEDMTKINTVLMNGFSSYMKAFSSPQDDIRFDMLPEDYKKHILTQRETILSNIEGIESVPEDLKPLVYGTLPNGDILSLFDYEDRMNILYKEQYVGGENDTIFTPVKPNRSYYSFLHLLDLNNPPLNPHIGYPAILKCILTDPILNIPRMDDQSVEDWLKEVKNIVADLIGSNTGLFYDMLAFHAFLSQLDDGALLSDKQKENIQAYFKNPTFVEYLFTINEEIIKMRSNTQLTIHETPKVAKEKLMEAIISSYKGKVVLVDFWATWCQPCIMSMREIEPIKQDMIDKNVVFVYITGPSSPTADFEKRIKKIAGEHYYLTEEEWNYIFKNIESNSIPTYLIYDTNGVLKNKSIGYPGTNEMRKMIEELLP